MIIIYIYMSHILKPMLSISSNRIYPGPPVSSTNKADSHDKTEVALNTITIIQIYYNNKGAGWLNELGSWII